ncbi:hypothetical protein [Aliikangiella sp. IMCC44359]|uniref:hypothetical protein n=1 Tax=Aliikangiella sp. IMCC44359 TaxID=3459125 RepID=UPI00403B017E
MNIYLKCLFFVYVVSNVFGCISSVAESNPKQSFLKKQCNKAKQGKLDLKSLDYSSSMNNAYLFDCVVSVSISSPNMISGESKSKLERQKEKEEKIKIADFLLSKNINTNYTNEYGDTLLITTISSFLPNEWKEKTIKHLIQKGIDVSVKNKNGDSALDLAKYKGTSKMVELLSIEK